MCTLNNDWKYGHLSKSDLLTYCGNLVITELTPTVAKFELRTTNFTEPCLGSASCCWDKSCYWHELRKLIWLPGLVTHIHPDGDLQDTSNLKQLALYIRSGSREQWISVMCLCSALTLCYWCNLRFPDLGMVILISMNTVNIIHTVIHMA